MLGSPTGKTEEGAFPRALPGQMATLGGGNARQVSLLVASTAPLPLYLSGWS